MTLILANSSEAKEAYDIVTGIQRHFAESLSKVQEQLFHPSQFTKQKWLRNGGQYGGGQRLEAPLNGLFNRGSINVSQVHYPKELGKKLASATALSTIIHPSNPFAPSVHMHISWTETNEGNSYWRLMADLNPSIPYQEDKEKFRSVLSSLAPDLLVTAEEQGEKYFFIPALGRCRGICHFYLENYRSHDPKKDTELAANIGRSVVNTYIEIFINRIKTHPKPDLNAYSQQLAYHTLYFFQVLTLDRGTTAGLLIHNENDLGVLASLPAVIDRTLLASWISLMTKPQDSLLESILNVLPEQDRCEITDDIKLKIAIEIRNFYREYPKAVDLQAAGDKIPDTIGNHSAKNVD